jgi:TonB family protein
VGRRRRSEACQPRGQWYRWMVASSVLHAVLLAGLLLVLGTDTKPAATLRARLVTVFKADSPSPSERQTLAAPGPPPGMPASSARGNHAATPPSPPKMQVAAGPSLGWQAPLPEPLREVGSPRAAAALPADSPTGGASSERAGPPGEGVTRALPPRSGPYPSSTESTSPPVNVDSPLLPAPLEAVPHGVFLIPGGGGGGTGRVGVGASNRGVGPGGGGTSGAGGVESGTGRTGESGSGRGGSGSTGLASRGGPGGAGSGDGGPDILRSIRRQIEQNKVYPDAARREGLQGTVELRFRMAEDGSVETVEILRSSGFEILDEASQQTIRRAAPYPLVRGWIRLPLSYRLDQ